jgi:hypothetical protein
MTVQQLRREVAWLRQVAEARQAAHAQPPAVALLPKLTPDQVRAILKIYISAGGLHPSHGPTPLNVLLLSEVYGMDFKHLQQYYHPSENDDEPTLKQTASAR